MSLLWLRRSLLGVAAVVVASPALGTSFASAMAEAEWRLHASVFECKISHPIHLYGAAVFSQRAGEEPRFYLQQHNRQFSDGEIELSAQNPLWQEEPTRQVLERIDLAGVERPVQLDWRGSQELMAALQSGKRLVFARPAWYGEEPRVRVMVEPVGFRPALEAYQNCLSGLLPVNYDQIARTALYFPLGDDELPDQELQKLNQLALYVQADERVTEVFIDGHTDAMGLRADNLALAQRRAEGVAQYLTENGISENKIIVRWHGERYPVADNDSATGRAENRRVTIRVDRHGDQLSVLTQE